jgi:hypothetical protein
VSNSEGARPLGRSARVSRIVFSRVMWVGRATIFMAGLAVMTALLIALVLTARPAHAETITVDTTSNDPTLTDKCTLEGAITAANTNYADTITNNCAEGDPSSIARDTIEFDIPLTDPGCNATSGVCTISPRTGIFAGLPEITETVTIDGYTQPGAKANTRTVGNGAVLKIELDGLGSFIRGLSLGAYAPNSEVRGLVINDFNTGISITGTGNRIEGNFIGTDPSGTLERSNSFGVEISGSDNIIGGTSPDARNVISGNDYGGVYVSMTTDTRIEGNFIGTTKNGTGNLGNSGTGVSLVGASNNTVGDSDPSDGATNAANTIAYNSGDGVSVNRMGNSDGTTFTYSTGNRILSNSIFSNAGLGINLNDGTTPNDDQDPDTGSNNLQNYPVINSAKTKGTKTTIKGTLNSTASTDTTPQTFTIQFFSSPKSTKEEGKKFKGQLTGVRSVTTDAQGNATFSIRVPKASGFVTATATSDATNDTSEFSLPKRVVLLQ